jgi:hypothetical protein
VGCSLICLGGGVVSVLTTGHLFTVTNILAGKKKKNTLTSGIEGNKEKNI